MRTLVERDAERAELAGLIERAARGAGGVLAVTGPPGIGKTALLADVAGRARRAGIQVLTARGGELEQDFPYGVVRQLFEPLVDGRRGRVRPVRADGSAGMALGLLGAAETPRAADASALEHAFFRLTSSLADAAPVALLVDDLQWADPASVRTLVYLARRAPELAVALLVTSRPSVGERDPLHERLLAEAGVVLTPAPLSDGGVQLLVRGTVGTADDEFCHACHAASGGNPFLVTELLTAATAAGLAPTAASADRVRSVTPQGVLRSVGLRLAAASPSARSVAAALAVLGEDDRVEVIADVAGVAAPQAAAALDELRRAHLTTPEGPARFVHALVRDVVYRDLPAAERSRLHELAARTLAAAGDDPDRVAGQLLLTAPGTQAWVRDRLVAAASGPAARCAPDTATAYFERALREAAPPDGRRPALLYALGAARFQTVDGDAIGPLGEALDVVRAGPGDPALEKDVVRALASALMTQRRYAEAWTLVDDTIPGLGPEHAVELELFAAQAVFTDVDPATAAARVAAWRPDPSGAGPRDRSMLAFRAWIGMHQPVSDGSAEAAARVALSTGTLVADDVWLISFELSAWTLLAQGCADEALAHLDAALRTLHTEGRVLRAATVLPVRAELHRRCGRLALAEADARTAVDTLPDNQIYVPQAVSALALVLLDQGRTDEAVRLLDERAAEIPPGGLCDVLWFARGAVRIETGDVARGVADLLHFGEICERLGRRNPGWYPWRSTAASGLARLGERAAARELAAAELRQADITGLPGPRGRALAALGIAETDGTATLREAVDLLDASPAAVDACAARVALGRSLRLHGRRDAARDELRTASDAAGRLGAGLLADRARDELLAAGSRPRRVATTGPAALTPSELRVATLAAQALTNREIAQTLYVTAKTVEAHLGSSYRKLGVAGRAGLAAALLVPTTTGPSWG